jgi:hypothetical protein
VKQSFEQRLKRQGITAANEEESSLTNKEEEYYLEQFRNCRFWIWGGGEDKQAHRLAYQDTKGKCCFNHMIGLPVKNNQTHPIYPWQQEIFDALWDSKRNVPNYKMLALLKSRGIGASELLLRYCSWLCLKDNQMQGKNIAIITGIRENLSLELLNRFRNLLPDYDWKTGPSSNIAEINLCRLLAFPSKRVKDLRGLTDTKLVIADEFAFFDPTDQQQILPVLEAFRAKSDAQIVLLSTPGPINDVYYNLFQEPEDKCRYHRLYLPYQKALGTLFTNVEIAQAKKQPGFSQEFELKFGSYYSQGTIFNLADIEQAINLGKRYANPKFNPMAAKVPYPYIDPIAEVQHYIGCDPGWGNSKTGITMVSLIDNKAHIIIAEEHYQKDEDFIIQRLLRLRERTGRPKRVPIFVDGSAVSLIRRLKSCIPGEITDYENYIDNLRKRKLIRPPQEMQLLYYMQVIPVPFGKFGPSMLSNLHTILSQGNLVIHPKFTSLISQLQSARNVTNNRNSQFILEKTPQNSMDLLDSLRLALWNIEAGAPMFIPESDEEEENVSQEDKVITVR